jgi:hypothetical protein
MEEKVVRVWPAKLACPALIILYSGIGKHAQPGVFPVSLAPIFSWPLWKRALLGIMKGDAHREMV